MDNRPRIPEDDRPNYDAEPKKEYTVTMPDGTQTTIDDVELAERVVESGGSIDRARKGWA